MKRRDLFRRATVAGSVATVGTVPSVSGRPIAAARRYEDQPDHVTLRFDRDRLMQYRPLLDFSSVPDQLVSDTTLYAWIAESEERTTDAYCYWAYYPKQEGVFQADSHVPDREPVYVFVDEDGDVDRVTYDGYHYLAYTDLDPRIYNETHPWVHVIATWHPYRRPTPSQSTDVAQYIDLGNFHDWYGVFLRNGWEVHQESVVNPWSIEDRGHWWADTVSGEYERIKADLGLTLAEIGLDAYAGGESDLVDSTQTST